MGNSVSRVVGCFVPSQEHHNGGMGVDDLGVTFCYIRPTLDSSTSQFSGDQSNSNSSSLNPDSSEGGSSQEQQEDQQLVVKTSAAAAYDFNFSSTNSSTSNSGRVSKNISETSFKSISGASVSANTSTSRSITSLEHFTSFANGPNDRTAAFESTSSFTALPLQPIPRGVAYSGPITGGSYSGPLDVGYRGSISGPLERGAPRACFTSGPLERVSISGPLDRVYSSGPLDHSGMLYSSGSQRRRKKSLADYVKDASIPVRRALSKTVSNIARSRKSHKRGPEHEQKAQDVCFMDSEVDTRYNLQWAQGKAGEDRVHIVLSEEHGWMFVGIYDGFNGPDAPDFLMSTLYPAIYKELQGLLWDQQEAFGFAQGCSCDYPASQRAKVQEPHQLSCMKAEADGKLFEDRMVCDGDKAKKSSLPRPKANRPRKHKKLFQWRYDWDDQSHKTAKDEMEQEVDSRPALSHARRGPVDHSGVLEALARALAATEKAYLEMTERAVVDNPELAVVGSCLLVMLMKDEDVYVMNVGDSRAVLAQDTRSYDASKTGKASSQCNENKEEADHERIGARDSMLRMELERIIEETPTELAALETPYNVGELAPPPISPTLEALQLSSDHSTSIEEEVLKIRMDHPDDEGSISNDRVKGRLKVTRAFGAGFLKQPKLNDALLEMFRIDFVGDAPYITCKPSLQHHRLGPRDQFLVLSSDGLYQYLSNEEVVAHVEWFLEKFPDADPAQYLIEELLLRAASKAGMDFHELLDIPQGDRRRYHDDVSLLVISLEGRIWRSSS